MEAVVDLSGYYPGIYVEGLRNAIKISVNLCSGRDSNRILLDALIGLVTELLRPV
jgi:hypothetical protein